MSSTFVVSTSNSSSFAPGVGNTVDNNESATFATSSADQASSQHVQQPQPLEETMSGTSNAPELSTLGITPPAVTKSHNAGAFSDDLRRILSEVATKGSSSVLPWKQDNVMVWTRPASRSANHPEGNVGRHSNNISNYTSGSSSTRRHHDHHNRSSHKRPRMSTMTSQQRHLHTSNRSSSTTATATMTATMVLESKNASSIRKSFPNVSLQQQQPTTTTSGLFVLRPQSSSSPHTTIASTTSTGTSTYTSTNTPSVYQNSLAVFLPNATSGRATGSIASYTAASGSEHEDTSQYECDSEGTSATSNSEMSFSSSISKRRGIPAMGNIGTQQQQQRANLSLTIAKRSDQLVRPQYLSVRDALMSALSFVLDYYYQNRGGYKLSPLEQRIYNVVSVNNVNAMKNDTADHDDTNTPLAARKSEEVFQKRKKRLLEMLGRYCNAAASDQESSDTEKGPNIVFQGMNSVKSSPPFTIQRLAEVLMEPERYYSQTHKLCNCIEKLLLVTSSVSAFGGNIGGGTTQSRQEETEIAALTEERKRLRSEFRQRHKKSRRSSNTAEIRANERSVKMGAIMDEHPTGINPTKPGGTIRTSIPDADADDDDDELLPADSTIDSKNDILDAAARATLRSKFDHVGIDPHSPAAMANSRDVMAMMESRRLLNSASPPPPPLSHNALQQQQLHPRQLSPSRSSPSPSSSPESSKAMLSPRIPSPLLFHNYNPVYEAGSPTTLSPILSPSLLHPMSVPLPQRQHYPNLSLPIAAMMSAHNHQTGSGTVFHGENSNHGVEALQKSSPASSDLDSESDIDDSASDDRSDGSDNERSLLLYEPLTAAQAMALNRRHQQARMQNRLLTAAATQQQQITSHANQNHSTAQSSGIMDGYHHRSQHTESTTAALSSKTVALEYKSSSGDSLDSKRAEDSGGSDSSSSDHAD